LSFTSASAQLLELHAPECLRHDVGELILHPHELDVDVSALHALTDEVISDLNVFALVVKDRVLCQCYR
jgi:hypothetical protein